MWPLLQRRENVKEKEEWHGETNVGLFLALCVSLGTAVVFPDRLYLANQSASRGLHWTLNFSLSKHNLTYRNLECGETWNTELLMNWKSSKLQVVSNDSIKAARAEPRTQQSESIPDQLSPKTNVQWGTGAGDKAGWAAESLNSPLSPSKSHNRSYPFSKCEHCRFYMWHISCRSSLDMETQWGAECSKKTVANFFRHLWADMLQGHHVSKAQATLFQFSFERGILQSHYYCSVPVCQQTEPDWTIDRTV